MFVTHRLILLLLASVLLLPFGCGPREGDVQTSKDRMRDQNNLKQMALAMHFYHDTNGGFPMGYFDQAGNPLLSWRVAILPYIEQDHLFRKFKLDEPWDSPNNLPLSKEMPKVYLTPGVSQEGDNVTHYRIFVADPMVNPAPAFKNKVPPGSNRRGPSVAMFMDGMSNTLGVVQSEDAVIWSKPDELVYDPKLPLPKLGKFTRGGSFASMMDGSVHFVSGTISESALRNFICANDGAIVDYSELGGDEDDNRRGNGKGPWPPG